MCDILRTMSVECHQFQSQELVLLDLSSISVIKFCYQCDLKEIELSRFHFSSSKMRLLC